MRRRDRRIGVVLCLLAGGVLAASCGGDETPPSVEQPDASDPHRDAGPRTIIDGGHVQPADATDAGPVRWPVGLDARPRNETCVAPVRPSPAAKVTFEPAFTTISPFDRPMMLVQLPGDSTHWLLAQRSGKVVRFSAVDPQTPEVVADLATLSGRLVAFGGEGGFLGMAPHPKFAQNGRVYVSWTSGDPAPGYYVRSRIGYITSTDGGATFTSYGDVLHFDQLYATHYGGGIAFGRDGFLYVSFGDGADYTHGQATTEFFSKVLRIDVDSVPAGATYGIPDDNPFKSGGGEPATFAHGFRNPFRLSFDRATGDLWVGDVGEANYEEIDRVERGGNYGWACREGMHTYSLLPAACPNGSGNSIDPIVEHEHVRGVSTSRSITGGVVYRGKAVPSFVGTYVYGDYVTGEIFALTFDPTTGAPVSTLIDAPSGHWVHFAEDNDGEVYAVDLYGWIYKMVPAPGAETSAFPARLSETGCVAANDPRLPAPGLVPYGVNAPSWADGAEAERFLAIPDGEVITVGTDGRFELPPGSVVVQTFSLAGKRTETRLLVRHQDGLWAGYSYAWLDDESDAVLLPANSRKRVGTRDWYFPSRGECMQCHTERAGRLLGLELGQLDGDLLYASTNRISNQLATLEHIGLFADPLPAERSPIPSPFGADPVERRARAYLHANCSSCHRPPGEGRTGIDLRFTTDLVATSTCDVAPSAGDLGVGSAKIVAPKDPSRSMLSRRLRSTGAYHMPPRGSVVDQDGATLIDRWIADLASCPQ